MSWLIDAEVLIEDIENNGDKAIIDMIESQPIAYDLEAVVKAISCLNLDGIKMIEDGKHELIRKSEAIEIVRNGGVK